MAKARLPVPVITIAITGNITGKHHSKEPTWHRAGLERLAHTKLPSRSGLKGAACKLVSPSGHIIDCSPNSLSLPLPSFPVNYGGFHAFWPRILLTPHIGEFSIWWWGSDKSAPLNHQVTSFTHCAFKWRYSLSGWFGWLILMVVCWLCFAVVWKLADSLEPSDVWLLQLSVDL